MAALVSTILLILGLNACPSRSLRYTPAEEAHNLNTNVTAENPLDYFGQWEDHDFTPSPKNWRFPFYTLFLDRFVNGNPSNDNANGTVFEQDITSTQFRHGGDVQGLVDSLDYLQGTGIKGIYVAGSPFINQPWQSDSYSPLDLTLLDYHFGNIAEWRQAVDEIHRRGMYILLDNTISTMGDLIGFEGFLNESTPFRAEEHKVLWKSSRRYLDFAPSNEYKESCDYPRFWNETGFPVEPEVGDMFEGCYDGDFDQYGDTEAFGVYPDYRRQLTKFASVQDRLREWVPSVRERLEHFSCLTIRMLDIDGFRYDKAIQATVDASGQFSSHLRKCARDLGKENFFLPGEITGGNNLGSVYLGRGRQPDQYIEDLTDAMKLTNESSQEHFMREPDQGALDAAAFHYSVYRFLTRFLGMDGNLEAGYDLPSDWVEAWNQMILTNDFVNPNTGKVDPRHMFGVTNQDVFRWPGISQGIERFLLGQFITSLLLPGIPILLWGEEVAFNVLENTADNYIFGRQAMSSSPAWHIHGCYSGGSSQYYQFPLESALTACNDVTNSWDHRDPAHPVRNIIKSMFYLREQTPVLNDGFYLDELSKQTDMIQLPGSNNTETEMGIWSVRRAPFAEVQDVDAIPQVWLVYHNRNETTTYDFDCSSNDSAIVAPFLAGTTVKNLLFPHDEIELIDSPKKLGFNGSEEFNGCTRSLTMQPYDFRVYQPLSSFESLPPMITKFSPGHDHPIMSTLPEGQLNSVDITFHFSAEMSCDDITSLIGINSTTSSDIKPRIDESTVDCGEVNNERPSYSGAVPSAWYWSATLRDVADGIHQIVISDAKTRDAQSSTGATDKFLFRIGKNDNPIVHPTTANYSSSLLFTDGGSHRIEHKAHGADKWRYSLNWGSSWSTWEDLTATTAELEPQSWSGTDEQRWDGDHVMVQYWSKLLGSSSFIQHGDTNYDHERRLPHLFANGAFNQFGYDAGLRNTFQFQQGGRWDFHYMDEWPARLQFNVWGINPDGQPDQSFVYGDIDGDGTLDRLNPSSLLESAINVTDVPPYPHIAYRFALNDATLTYEMVPAGSQWVQLTLYIIFWVAPILTGLLAVFAFMGSFYKVKYVKRGPRDSTATMDAVRDRASGVRKSLQGLGCVGQGGEPEAVAQGAVAPESRTVRKRRMLVATIEHNIDDWNIKVKIGGLGVMAELMSKSLTHQDLVWVVPCVGDIDYPDYPDERAEAMEITILGRPYLVDVHYHQLNNITYVLLDAPIFRQATRADPYPPRMDDMDSAIYYSTWNQCIAQTMMRFPIDLYHINDYHGALAPLYLLPNTISCCMSLHNAEFQGLWPMRTEEEREEVCGIFNLSQEVAKKYVQFGSVFNLLHAGASYLRIHQSGYGAVGVSKKYGDRSHSRYPIFWGLSHIGQLPNPDPSDITDWDKSAVLTKKEVTVDAEYETQRGELRMQAQAWAGLEINPHADLFVFVGRWSEQKGVDLIADIFPSILEDHPGTQLICVGPIIDLYGKFAALKLSKLMEKYPRRVFSRPEFTVLPPCIHTGAEFALIPSRDEPFGLVAVEFGRKGALGVGARVGGLGQMPGWWYTIESPSTSHLLRQFKQAIEASLECRQEDRAMMRAWSAKQRFPVAQWLEGLEKLQHRAIKMHLKTKRRSRSGLRFSIVEDDDDATGKDHGTEAGISDCPTQAGSRPPSPDSRPVSMQMLAIPRSTSSLAIPSIAVPSSGWNTPIQTPTRFTFDSDVESGFEGSGDESPRNSARASRMSSVVNLFDIVGERRDFALQQVDPNFTDADGKSYAAFEKKLLTLDASNSTTENCIEEFLVKSERRWFNRRHDAKLGSIPFFTQSNSSNTLTSTPKKKHSTPGMEMAVVGTPSGHHGDEEKRRTGHDEFGLGENYVPPTGLRKWLQIKWGNWPVYSFLLALGQIIASNSYQITLLTGEIGQSATRLYTIAGIYLGFSIVWAVLSRYVKLLYVLTTPFLLYGAAFILVGASPFITNLDDRALMQNFATGVYAAASASGSLFFAFNFGDEASAPITIWIWRACCIQGAAHAYTIGLWFWGSFIAATAASGKTEYRLEALPVLFPVTVAVAVLLWTVGIVLFIGLPDFYRHMPGKVPTLYTSILKRKTTVWFFVAVILQNYFLSAPYGRNWFFLFSSKHLSDGAVLGIACFFLFGVWAVFLFYCGWVSKHHPWWLPLFALGLGAPRWAQILWGTSSFGLYLPWAGSHVASAILSRCLWLWLGLLDAIQNAGIGMILMVTLTRVHVSVAMMTAQVIGSAATMTARATAPNRLGPGDVFPDFSMGLDFALSKAWFWVGLAAQLLICVGFFKFFRKEQINKP